MIRSKKVFVDDTAVRLAIPTGLRLILHKLGLKLYRFRKIPVGADIYIDLLRSMILDQPITIFDVGANVGQSSLEYAYYFPNATIHSFEHVSQTFERLKENVANLESIKPHHYALGPQNETVVLRLQEKSTNNSLNPVVQEGKASHSRGTGKSEVVKMLTLDNFCTQNKIGRIDFLKLDAGGFDLRILEGASRLLQERRIKRLFVEVTLDPRNPVHCQFNTIATFLEQRGMFPVALYDQKVTETFSNNYYANALFSAAS